MPTIFKGERNLDGSPRMGLVMEDFAFDAADVTAYGIQKVISRDILRELEPMLVGEEVVYHDRKMVGKEGQKRLIRKKAAGGDAINFTEGQDVPAENPKAAPSTVEVEPLKFGHSEVVFEESIDDMDLDAVIDVEKDLADGMARKSDSDIWTVACGTTQIVNEAMTAGDGSTKRFALDHHPILQMDSVTVAAAPKVLGTDYYCDFYRGAIEFVVAPVNLAAVVSSYLYSTRTYYLEANTIKKFQRNDIVDGGTEIDLNSKGELDTTVIHHRQLGDLKKDSQFVDYNRAGPDSAQTRVRGKVGDIAGTQVLKSQVFYEGVAFVCQKGKRLIWKVWKKNTIVKVVEQEDKAGDVKIKTWQRSRPGVADEKFCVLIFNCHRYAKQIKSGAI